MCKPLSWFGRDRKKIGLKDDEGTETSGPALHLVGKTDSYKVTTSQTVLSVITKIQTKCNRSPSDSH